MEPRIQYARTSDGVNIAYWAIGQGMPLVHLPYLLLSHIRLEWQRPRTRSFFEHLAERRRLIRYDCRGAGLSDRKVSDHSLEGLVLDLEAVVDRLGLATFALFAPARSGPAAITYTVRHPEKVTHLLLWASSARSADHTPTESTARWQALMTLMHQDWELYADLRSLMQYGWSHADEARWAAELMREASSPELYQAFDDALREVDVTPLLAEVKVPTLVMHRRGHLSRGPGVLTLDVARGLAARIPNALAGAHERGGAVRGPRGAGAEGGGGGGSGVGGGGGGVMEPRIQYVKSQDGVSIACWAHGEGRPLLQMPAPQWAYWPRLLQAPEPRSFWERLARGRRLVSYNARGTGQSDRAVADYSLEAQVTDLEAVVDHLAGERFDLIAVFHSSPIAIAYAARHPERVEYLVLWHPMASGRDLAESRVYAGYESLRSMGEKGWGLYVQVIASANFRGGSAELIRLATQVMRDGVTAQDGFKILDAVTRHDATELLDHVEAPTLVLVRRGVEPDHTPANTAVVQRVASRIPDSQLVLLEGDTVAHFLGDSEAVVRTIRDFLGEETPPSPSSELPSSMTAILFADIADSTALTERLGDAAFRAKARELAPALRALVRECAGQPVEGPTLGDGVLAVFTSAREAIEAARRCAKAGDDAGLPLHLGLHAGDVTREKDPDGRDNVYGGAVNIASRISGLSAPGEVLVSDIVRGLARTSAGVRFEDRGEQSLKGVGEPVRVWAVQEGKA